MCCYSFAKAQNAGSIVLVHIFTRGFVWAVAGIVSTNVSQFWYTQLDVLVTSKICRFRRFHIPPHIVVFLWNIVSVLYGKKDWRHKGNRDQIFGTDRTFDLKIKSYAPGDHSRGSETKDGYIITSCALMQPEVSFVKK